MPWAATSQQTTVASGGAIGGWVGFKLHESFPSRPGALACAAGATFLAGRRGRSGAKPRRLRVRQPCLPASPTCRSRGMSRPAQDNAARGIRTENGGFVSTALGPAHTRGQDLCFERSCPPLGPRVPVLIAVASRPSFSYISHAQPEPGILPIDCWKPLISSQHSAEKKRTV